MTVMVASLLTAFVHQARRRPGAIALVAWHDHEPTSYTWSRLAAMVSRTAASLETDRVGFASDNSLADVILPLACMASGAIEVPIDYRLGAAVHDLWNQVGGQWLTERDRERLMTRALQADDSAAAIGQLEKRSERVDTDQPALILWTSGTTASPQGVTLSHRNLLGNAQAKLAAVPQRADDVRLTALPLCHAYGRTCDFGTWLLSGCTLAVGLGFEAWERLGPVTEPTLANTVPSIARRMFSAAAGEIGRGRLRLLGCGGAAMSAAEFHGWRDRGVTVIQGYGLTETSPVICSATPDNAIAGLVGDFVDGWEHQIRDGRLFVRGPHVMLGYWNDEPATRDRVDEHGWLDTGDLVEIDADTGQLRIFGRADDVIVLSDGHKVHPQVIERELEGIPGIRHALIIGDDRHLQAWLDADETLPSGVIEQVVCQALADRPAWERPVSIHCFRPPLSAARGELTQKGAIKRQQILDTRAELFAAR
jgi:long-chain acyl-CoA synthetase